MNNKYLNLAVNEAQKAYELNEIPIGCVIVHEDEVLASAHNTREHENDISAHAEINALKIAAKKLNTWKLDMCEMYITVEPCLMCYGAIKQSRIKKVYIGSQQKKFKKNTYRYYISEPEFDIINLYSKQSADLMTSFFKKLRED